MACKMQYNVEIVANRTHLKPHSALAALTANIYCKMSPTPRFLSIATSTTISIWKIFFLHKIAFSALLRAGEHSYCGISILLLLYDEMTKEELHNSNLNQYGRDCWCEIDFIWMYDDDWVIKQYWGCVSLRRVVEHEKQ
jgi:hypothetical protein